MAAASAASEWLTGTATTVTRIVRAQRADAPARRRPCSEWLPDDVARDDKDFVLTGRDVPGASGTTSSARGLATTMPGVFAVGDIRQASMKRVAAASGEGSAVAAG